MQREHGGESAFGGASRRSIRKEKPLDDNSQRPTTRCPKGKDRNPLAMIDRAREYADASRAAATNRAYASDWRDFTAYCKARGLEALPATPQTVVLYLTDSPNGQSSRQYGGASPPSRRRIKNGA